MRKIALRGLTGLQLIAVLIWAGCDGKGEDPVSSTSGEPDSVVAGKLVVTRTKVASTCESPGCRPGFGGGGIFGGGTRQPIINAPAWDGAWSNIIPESHVSQSFTTVTDKIRTVEVGITTGNPGASDTITLILYQAGSEIYRGSKVVQSGFDGWLRYRIPDLQVGIGEPIFIELNDTGAVAFGWKYGGNTYSAGGGYFFGSETGQDFFFRVN